MLTVLDLDLDFFVWPVVRGPVEGRPSDSDLACASPEQVRLFLEEQCGLSRESSPVFVDTLGRTIVPLGSVSNNPATYTVGGLNYTVSYTTSSANFTAPSQTIGPFASQSGQYCTTNFTVPNTSTANGRKLDDGIS